MERHMNITLIRRLSCGVLGAAATAVILSAGAATSASAANNSLIQNPFGPKVPFTPKTRSQPAATPSDPDRPFSTPRQQRRPKYRSVAHYLLGIWNGRLKNGAQVRISFSKNGKFSLVDTRRGVAQVGHWRVKGLRVQLVAVGYCSRSRCHRYPQNTRVVFSIKPVHANAMRTPGGTFQRA
jgi:hypothetical protein